MDMKYNLKLFALAAVLFLVQCKNASFTSRKYTKGRYVEHQSGKEMARGNKPEKQKPITTTPEVKLSSSLAFVKSAKKEASEKIISDARKEPFRYSETRSSECYENKTKISKPGKPVVNEKALKGEYSKEFDKKALVGAVVSVAGFVFDVITVLLIIATESYAVLALFAIGLTLGIIGLSMSSKSLKRFKEQKRSGEKNISTLICGIVGIATGIAAIVAAGVLFIDSLFYLASLSF
jgi:hypothetical protein